MSGYSRGLEEEDLAVRFLAGRGYKILDRNWRCRAGEIDIVAKGPNGALVIAEVKSRSGKNEEGAWASLGEAKQKKLSRLALWYLKEKGLPLETEIRFDAVLVLPQGIRHEPGFFEPEREI